MKDSNQMLHSYRNISTTSTCSQATANRNICNQISNRNQMIITGKSALAARRRPPASLLSIVNYITTQHSLTMSRKCATKKYLDGIDSSSIVRLICCLQQLSQERSSKQSYLYLLIYFFKWNTEKKYGKDRYVIIAKTSDVGSDCQVGPSAVAQFQYRRLLLIHYKTTTITLTNGTLKRLRSEARQPTFVVSSLSSASSSSSSLIFYNYWLVLWSAQNEHLFVACHLRQHDNERQQYVVVVHR